MLMTSVGNDNLQDDRDDSKFFHEGPHTAEQDSSNFINVKRLTQYSNNSSGVKSYGNKPATEDKKLLSVQQQSESPTSDEKKVNRLTANFTTMDLVDENEESKSEPGSPGFGGQEDNATATLGSSGRSASDE